MYYVEHNFFYHFFNLIGIAHDQKTDDPFTHKHLVFYDTHTTNPKFRNKLFQILSERQKRKLTSEIVFEYSYEGGIGLTDLNDYIQSYLDHNIKLEDVKFIFNLSQNEWQDKLNHSIQFFNVDIFSISVLRHLEVGINQYCFKPLGERNPRINFLAAQLFYKLTRLQALHLLFKKNLIQNAIAGLLVTPKELSENKDKIIDKEFYNWLENNIGPADNVKLLIDSTNSKFLSNGNPYSPTIYCDTRVSYVCETFSEVTAVPYNFLTEKVYRPIFNRSPFILQGHPNQIDFLQSIGIDPYLNYTGNYNNSNLSYSDYVESAVDATENLLSATIAYPNDIDIIDSQSTYPQW